MHSKARRSACHLCAKPMLSWKCCVAFSLSSCCWGPTPNLHHKVALKRINFLFLLCALYRWELVHFTGGSGVECEQVPGFHHPLSNHPTIQRGVGVPGDMVLPGICGTQREAHIYSQEGLHFTNFWEGGSAAIQSPFAQPVQPHSLEAWSWK